MVLSLQGARQAHLMSVGQGEIDDSYWAIMFSKTPRLTDAAATSFDGPTHASSAADEPTMGTNDTVTIVGTRLWFDKLTSLPPPLAAEAFTSSCLRHR
jgi:hypothetical protein